MINIRPETMRPGPSGLHSLWYSITETAKANNLNPFRYLEYVLTVMKDHQEDTDYRFMEDLLPWSGQLPEICRSKTKTTNV